MVIKKKLLHIIDSLGVGGAEKLLIGVINELGIKYDQHLIVLKSPTTLFKEITVPCQFVNLNCTSFSDLFFQIRKVKKIIKDCKIDIVHSHLYEANLLARLATPKSVRLINSIHAISSLASYKINKISLHLEKLSYKKRHEMIGVSKAVLDDFDEWVGLKGRAEVMYNFIDDKFFVAEPKRNYSLNKLKLAAVGNLRWQKNYPYLFEALKNFKGDLSLDIYGEGDVRETYQEVINSYKLPVRLCGTRGDLERILPQYDFFVMSSFYEGQPVALLEAAALGIPALLSDIPVLRETAGENAVYFDIKNPESFSKVIHDILHGKYHLEKMANSLKSKIDQFAHKDQYITKLEEFYRQP